MMYWHL